MSHYVNHSSIRQLYRFLLLSTVIAILSVLGYALLPERTEQLLSNKAIEHQLFYDGQAGGKTMAEWLNPQQTAFKCSVGVDGIQWPYCGMKLMLAPGSEGRDLSRYQRLEVKLQYQGKHERLRIFMDNKNQAYANTFSKNINKPIVAEFLRAETEGTVVVQNYEWRTSDSWIADNKIPRHLSYPEFTNVIDIGIDLVSPIATGEHRVTVESIKLYGSMIAPDRWYLLVALLWLGANLIFIAKQLLKLEEQIYKDAIRLSSLADYSRSLEQQSEKYKELSHLDNLTGALSRHGLSHRLNEISNEGKLPERLALIVFDIDHFKQINDKNGHDGGDIVLKEISGYIRQHIRTGDNLVRWGGEEFVLCLSNSSLADAGLVAEKIRTGIAELSISVNSKIIPVTVSSGVSISKTGDTFEQLFHAADQALYRAKNSGRNRVVIAEQNSQ